MKKLAPFVMLALMTACTAAPTPPRYIRWTKPDAQYIDFMRDRLACTQGALTNDLHIYGGVGYSGEGDIVSLSVFTTCMEARGYVQDPQGFEPPSWGQSVAYVAGTSSAVELPERP